jgi:uncharacterized membrane-anchored protein YhcB (DUF1043 family)
MVWLTILIGLIAAVSVAVLALRLAQRSFFD